MALRTTVVGSWWKLDEHEEDLRRYHAGELGAEEGQDLLDRAATAAIAEQQELGLDEWTGGEYYTDNFIDHMQRVLHGVEIDKPDEPDPFDYDDLAHCEITGEMSAPDGLGYARAYERESQLPGGVRKATVVGPLEIAVHAQDQQEELKRQMPNLIGIVNREMRELAAAGCPHVQLDVPIFGVLVNMGQMTPDQAADIVIACFEGVEGVTRGIHICNGNFKGPPAVGHRAQRALGADPPAPRRGRRRRRARVQLLRRVSWSARPTASCPRACSSPPASSTRPATGSRPSRRCATAPPTGRAWSARSGCGSRPRAASGATRPARAPCSGRSSST